MTRDTTLEKWFQELNNASSRSGVAYIVNSFMSYYQLNYYPGNSLEDTAKVFAKKEMTDVVLFLRLANNKMNKLAQIPEMCYGEL